jgi:integrase
MTLLGRDGGGMTMDTELVIAETGDLAATSVPSTDQHPAAVYIARLAPGSRRTMREALDTIASILTNNRSDAEALPWHLLRYQHTQAVRSALAERYAPATANKMLAALRGVIKEAWRLGQMSAEDYHRAVDLGPVKGTTLPSGREVSQGELRAIFSVCSADKSAAGRRDAAIIALLYGAGLRRSEVVAIDLQDFNPETGELRIRAAKGHKDRTSYATNGSLLAVCDWLALRGDTPGPLFCPINKGGRLVVQQMTPQTVRFMTEKRAKQAGVQHFSPHDLRRTFIGDMLGAGADIVTVQHLAGHANVQTTARYDRRGEEAKRKAAELLHVPYVKSV